jgi:hypothetical protein
MELRGEPLSRLLEQRLDGPVLDRLESADLPLALDDEPQRDGLYATRGDPLLHRLPEHGAGLVADEPVEHASRLLGLDFLVVDRTRLQDGVLDRVLRDLVEEDPTHGDDRCTALRADLLGHVPGDRLSLAIRVGGDEHFARILRRALQVGDRLLLAGDRHELGLEALVDVDAELLLGQIHDVPDGSAHAVAAAQVLADRLRLGGRLDDDKRRGAGGRRGPLVLDGRRAAAASAALGGGLRGAPCGRFGGRAGALLRRAGPFGCTLSGCHWSQ